MVSCGASGATPWLKRDSAGRDRINRIAYEVSILETLREQLRCNAY
jgi:hypothetical protein